MGNCGELMLGQVRALPDGVFVHEHGNVAGGPVDDPLPDRVPHDIRYGVSHLGREYGICECSSTRVICSI